MIYFKTQTNQKKKERKKNQRNEYTPLLFVAFVTEKIDPYSALAVVFSTWHLIN